MAGSAVNVGHGSISISPVLAAGFGRVLQQQLNNVRLQPLNVGVQIDRSQLANLQRQVSGIRATANVGVNVDTGRARAAAQGLGNAFQIAFASIAANKIVEANNQISSFANKMTLAAAGITAAASAAGPLLGLLGGIGAAGVVAGAGLGSLAALAVPQFSAISDAVKNVTKAQDETTTSTSNLGSAQRQLASTQRSIADQRISDAEAIGNAQDQLAQSEQQAARQQIDDAQSIARAQDQLKQAEAEAARQQIEDARNIARAQDGLRAAQQAVNEARQQAVIDLRNLRQEQDRNALSVREAELNLQQQRIDTAKTLASTTATPLEKQFAQLHLDEAVQQLKDVQQSAADSATQFTAASKAGVNGSKQVVQATGQQKQAQQALADAQQQQRDDQISGQRQITQAQQAVAAARQKQTDDELSGQQQIAQARQALDDANRQQQSNQLNAIDQLASANEALAQAQGAGNKSALDQAAAMAKLTPAQRAAVTATLQLRDALKAQSDAIAGPFLAAYVSGVHTAIGLLPTLGRVASATGTALQGIFARAQAGIVAATAPGGGISRFADLIVNNIGPILRNFAAIIVNIGRTLGNVFQSLVPLMFPALTVLRGLTATLSDSSAGQGLVNFFAQVRPLLPAVGGAIFAIVSGLGALIRAAVPLAGPVLAGITAIADALRNLFISAPFQAFVSNIGNAIRGLLPLFNSLVGPIGIILATISGQVAQLIPILVPVVQSFADVFSRVIVGLSPLLPLFAQLAGILISLFLPVLYPIIAAFRQAMVPVLGAVGAALIQIQPAIAQLAGVFVQILPVIGQLVAALIPLIPALIQGLVPGIQLFGAAVNVALPLFTFLAQHMDTVAKVVLPLLIVALLAHKSAQTASNIATALALPLRIAEITATFMSASANRALAFQLQVLTGVQQQGRIATALSTIATIAQTIASWAATAATLALSAATWLLNGALAVLTSPITLVIVAIAALAFGVFMLIRHFTAVHDFLNGPWGTAISIAIAAVLPFIGIPMLIIGHWQGLVTFFQWMWNTILHPIFNALVAVARVSAIILISLVIAPIKLAWIALSIAFKAYWDFVLHPVLNAFMSVARFLWASVLEPVFRAIRDAWSFTFLVMKAAWDRTMHPVFSAFGTAADVMRRAFRTAVDDIKRVWDSLGGIFKAPINAVVFPVIRNLSHAVDEVTQFALDRRPLQQFEDLHPLATGGMVTGPGTGTSDSILGVDARGVPTARVSNGEYVVNARQTASYLPVLEAINSGSLPGFFGGGLLGAIKNAGGALVGGAVGGIKKLAGAGFDALSWAGEKGLGVLRTGAADALDAAYRAFSGPLFGLLPNTGPGQMFHAIPDRMEQTLVDWIRGKEEAAGDFSGADGTSAPLILEYLASKGIRPGPVTTTTGVHAPGSYHYKGMAVDFGNVGNPNQRGIFNIFDAVASSLLELFWDPAGHYVKNGRKVAGAIGGHMDHVHVAATMDAMNRLLGRGGGGSVGNLRGLVVQALSREGYPTSGPYVDAVLRQIQFESSGNPRAVQGAIGDINNRTGNLARGLMQVIPPTFAAYRDPGLPNDIFNPLANVAAALRYVRGRYGGNVTGILGHGHGYDSGGWLMPGTTLAYNQTGRPEAILTSQQWDAITSLAGGSGRTGPLVETAIIREMADVDLLAAQLDHRQRVGGF